MSATVRTADGKAAGIAMTCESGDLPWMPLRRPQLRRRISQPMRGEDLNANLLTRGTCRFSFLFLPA